MKTDKNSPKKIITVLGVACIVLSIILVAIIVIFATALQDKDWQIANLQAQVNQNLSTQEKIRDSIIDYIKFNHPETAQFTNNLTWAGGRTTPINVIGAETYIFTSNGWTFTINYPVVPNPLHNVTADYSTPFTGIPYRIIWEGSWQNWCITEYSYVFAQ